MSELRFGCQTYTWEMQLDSRPATLWEMCDAMASAGYAGVEFTSVTGAAWLRSPDRVAKELEKRNLALAAVAAVRAGYTDPDGLEDDLKVVERVLGLLTHFPGAILAFGGAAHADTDNWKQHLDTAIKFYSEAGAMAAAAGVPCAVHPHSHHGSLLESQAQYDYLFNKLPDSIGWCPDTGHILRGGQQLFTCLERYAARIRYVHLKDVDSEGEWQPLGAGQVDLPALIAWLRDRDFSGWLIAEEESPFAWHDPTAAVTANAKTLRKALMQPV